MTRPPIWSDAENDAIATAYLVMLAAEHRGESFNKAAARRAVLPALNNRTAGSYEMKCCNISAVLNNAGLAWINGYKPLGHGQAKPLAIALARAADRLGWPHITKGLQQAAKVTT